MGDLPPVAKPDPSPRRQQPTCQNRLGTLPDGAPRLCGTPANHRIYGTWWLCVECRHSARWLDAAAAGLLPPRPGVLRERLS